VPLRPGNIGNPETIYAMPDKKADPSVGSAYRKDNYMKKEGKKNLERIYVEWFIKEMKWNKVSIVDDEEPDFGIVLLDKKIGLEVTNLFKYVTQKGSLIKREESIKDKWLLEVANEYYKLSSIPIKVSIRFIRGGKCDPKLVARELANRNNMGILEKSEFVLEISKNCHLYIYVTILPGGIEELRNYKRWTVLNNYCGWSSELTEKSLVDVIKRKADKLERYRKKYENVSLLIVADRTKCSGMFHLTKHLVLPNHGFSSIFLGLFPEECKQIG
jgi:hypothetical protein